MITKFIVKKLLRHTPFYPRHIGAYTREIYFWEYIERLPVKKFSYVLDAGCGGGEYAREIAIKYPHLKINAYDIKKHKSWNVKPRNVNFKQRDLLGLEEKNCYDFCLSIDVLEHIPENLKVLENIHKALKMGGYFYLHMPSKDERRIFQGRCFREFYNWAEEEHIGDMYKFENFKSIITSLGFKIIEARETFGFFGSFAWKIDRMTDRHVILKVVLMPMLKFFAHLDVKFLRKGGGILILGKKR